MFEVIQWHEVVCWEGYTVEVLYEGSVWIADSFVAVSISDTLYVLEAGSVFQFFDEFKES
jgi:hypothetical protein